MRIAVDGPAASGKSSVAKQIAKIHKLTYIDTGAMYRAIANYFLKNKIEKIEAKTLELINIKFNESNEIIVNGVNEDAAIRSNEECFINKLKEVANNPKVRTFLGKIQKEMAKQNNIIMDGRDIGTFIMPDADIKIYITASVEIRAKRRYDQSDKNIPLAQIKDQIIIRDKSDLNREMNPLKKAPDAYLVDSTNLNFEQTVEAVDSIIERKKCQIQLQ